MRACVSIRLSFGILQQCKLRANCQREEFRYVVCLKGNYHNQLVVFDNKVCDYVNYILRGAQFHGCSDKEVTCLFWFTISSESDIGH